MRRLALLGVAAIAVLCVVAMAFVYLVTEQPPGSTDRAQGTPPPEERAAPEPVAPPAPAEAAPPAMATPAPAAPAPAPRTPTPDSAEPRTLARPIPSVSRALVKPLAPCFDEDTQVRFGPNVPRASPRADLRTTEGATVLLLELEVLGDGLRVVDAPIAARGKASDGLLSCAQQVLRGRTVPLPPGSLLAAGERLRMQFVLGR